MLERMVFVYITRRIWNSKFKGYMSFLKINVGAEVIFNTSSIRWIFLSFIK